MPGDDFLFWVDGYSNPQGDLNEQSEGLNIQDNAQKEIASVITGGMDEFQENLNSGVYTPLTRLY